MQQHLQGLWKSLVVIVLCNNLGQQNQRQKSVFQQTIHELTQNYFEKQIAEQI